ncbi:hypothetical protein [Formosa haliotis]|uniref:hypothetical protein n=1 Tax=Formosa haliotis TaxID=1555194 RepID=UPI0008253E3C|nr:hypothetical protein [Formosa haliotis]
MKQIHKFFAVALVSAAMFSSCSKDDDDNTPDVPNGIYDHGYFVLNEGQFGNPRTSGVTFIGEDGSQDNDIFENVNPTASELGDALQSMFFDDDHAYIISGASNQITVVDRYSFEYIATIDSDLASPRYGAIAEGKAYVTNSNGWDDGSDDFVTVIDLTDYSTSTFNMKNAERVIEDDDMIYFANGYFGAGNRVTVLDPNTESTTEIDLGEGNSPNSLEEEDGSLYVLTNNAVSTSSSIFKINLSTNTIALKIDLPAELQNAKQLHIEDDIMYFTNATSVFKLNTNADENSFAQVLEYESTSEYGAMYGFAVEDDKIYIADAGDFASAGTTYEYSLSGSLINTYTVGVGPNGFYFND